MAISGTYNGAVPQKSCSTQHTIAGTFFLLLTGRAKTGWHSNTVNRCYKNLLSPSFALDICNFVRLDTGVFSLRKPKVFALQILRRYLTNKDRVRKLFYCLIRKREPWVRKFEGLALSKIFWVSQTVLVILNIF